MPISISGSGTITGISAGGLPDGCVTGDDIANSTIPAAKLGTTEQSQLCKAWVNFNGTGVVAIRASYNVSSITDNGVGDYTVNFTTAMPDANYAPLATAQPNTADSIVPANGQCEISIVGTTGSASLPSASGYRIYVGYSGTHPRDVSGMYTAVFR